MSDTIHKENESIEIAHTNPNIASAQEQPFVVPNTNDFPKQYVNFAVTAGSSQSSPNHHSTEFPAMPPTDAPLEDQSVKAYMMSIVSDFSYDVPQQMTISSAGLMETKRISYKIFNTMIDILFDTYEHEDDVSDKNIITEAIKIIDIIKITDKKNIIFNFECCGCLKNHEFPKNAKQRCTILQFISIFVRQGYSMIFADFSVFALIKNWTACSGTNLAPILLGECPFVVSSTKCNSGMVLVYSIDELIGCPIPQLQALGKLSEKGQLRLHALKGTIVFGKKEVKNQPYTTNVYTTVTQIDGIKYDFQNKSFVDTNIMCSAVGITDIGFIGHSVVTYPEGGKIIVSAGHFTELTKIHTNSTRLAEMIAGFPKHMQEKYTTTLNATAQMPQEAQEHIYSTLASDMLHVTSGG